MADTIRILVATDNHVGYSERDPVRGDDSWRTFDEIMGLARKRDVDMVLLAGDLFHENKPSRKSMYNVMRSLRMNCFGDKPCELEMLSDESEHFDATFTHVNYEDPDINVAIPVFSIHGNHDDPTGEGHYAALDLLAMSGLLNYYGKTPQSDNITVKPVLMQKGRTKLALYGLSNVRDERLYRTFRDGKVKFFQPSTQKDDWFNLICVHQNHHAHTETSYLPENFLPEFLDLVIWGHEHECDIEPHMNPEMNFRVMQPGSSVATSLVPGEAATKHVAILNITGREFKSEPIRLKTVRPFVYKEIILSKEKEAVKIGKKDNHRPELTRFLIKVVEGLIQQAEQEWQEAQAEGEDDDEEDDEEKECPLPIIRLRVEVTPADGVGKFDIENPQRFSNRFTSKVANTSDIVQFYQKKKSAPTNTRNAKDKEAEKEVLARIQALDTVKVGQLVREFLAAQSLTILPQNYFGDAVTQFIDKDDKHAMEMFVTDSLSNQIKHLVTLQEGGNKRAVEDDDEEDLATQIDHFRTQMEEMFAKGALKIPQHKARLKPRPDDWDSDFEGSWAEQPGALIRSDDEDGAMDVDDDEENGTPAPKASTRGARGGRGAARGRGRVGAASTRGASTTTTRKPAASAAKPTKSAPKQTSRTRRNAISDDDDDGEDDIMMLDDDNESEDQNFSALNEDEDENESSQAMFFSEPKTKSRAKPGTTTTTTTKPAITKLKTNGTKPTTTNLSTTTNPKKAPSRITTSSSSSTAAATAAAKNKQATLNFTASQNSVLGLGARTNPSAGGRSMRNTTTTNTTTKGKVGAKRTDEIEDDSDDDDEAFESAPASTARSRRR